MKRAVVVLLFLLVAGSILFAQQSATKVFVKTLPIAKILSHQYGYKVVYRTSDMRFGSLYIPHTWFVAGGKGEIIWGKDRTYPYLSVFYRDGKFDFIRLYVEESVQAPSWGVLRSTEAFAQKFEVDTIEIDF